MNIRDIRHSLFQYLVNRTVEFGIANITVLPSRSMLKEDRPIWVVDSVPSTPIQTMTPTMSFLDARYNMMFLTNGFNQAEDMGAFIGQDLANRRWKIAGWLHDFVYPAPIISGIVGGGTVPAGDYFVAVSGLGMIEDIESLSSVAQEVTLGAIGQIRIIIPRYPRGLNFFRKYNVYVGSSAATMKLTADSPIDTDEFTTTVKLVAGVPAGVAPPTQSDVKFRPISVLPESFTHSVLQEPGTESGKFISLMTITVRAPIRPIEVQGEPLEGVAIDAEYSEGGPDETETIVQTP